MRAGAVVCGPWSVVCGLCSVAREVNVSDTIPTDSLMRYLRATADERAAIDRFLRERDEKWLKAEGRAHLRGTRRRLTYRRCNRAQTEELKAELKLKCERCWPRR